jgi:hypothetical protein
MRGVSTGAQGNRNLPAFAASTIIAAVCFLLLTSSAFAQGRGSNSSALHASDACLRAGAAGYRVRGIQQLAQLPALYFFEKVPLTEAFNRTTFMSAPKPPDAIFPQ